MDDFEEIKLDGQNAPVNARPIAQLSFERVRRKIKPLSQFFPPVEAPENVVGKEMLKRIKKLLPLQHDVSAVAEPRRNDCGTRAN